MTRMTTRLCAAAMALAPWSLVASAQSAPDAEAMQTQAKQTCADALDHDRFGTYTTMEECVGDTVRKMKLSYRTDTAKQQAAALSRTSQPN